MGEQKAERNWPDDDTLNVRMMDSVQDIQAPWNTRGRFDREVLGAIELAYLRGARAGEPERILPNIRAELEAIDLALCTARDWKDRCREAQAIVRRLLDQTP